MKLDDKKMIVENLNEKFQKSKVVIIADYKGLDVLTVTNLRRKLREADVEFKVIKNTLIKRASEGTDVSVLSDYLAGPNALAISYDDPVAPAKILSEFAKENDKLDIKVGVMDGKVMDLDSIKVLADLPSRDELLAQLLSVINGVPTSFVTALNDVMVKFVNVLEAVKDQKEAA